MTYYLVKRPFIASGETPDFGHVAEDEVVLVDVAALSDERWKAEDLRVQLSNERSRHEKTRAERDEWEAKAESFEHAMVDAQHGAEVLRAALEELSGSGTDRCQACKRVGVGADGKYHAPDCEIARALKSEE